MATVACGVTNGTTPSKKDVAPSNPGMKITKGGDSCAPMRVHACNWCRGAPSGFIVQRSNVCVCCVASTTSSMCDDFAFLYLHFQTFRLSPTNALVCTGQSSRRFESCGENSTHKGFRLSILNSPCLVVTREVVYRPSDRVVKVLHSKCNGKFSRRFESCGRRL